MTRLYNAPILLLIKPFKFIIVFNCRPINRQVRRVHVDKTVKCMIINHLLSFLIVNQQAFTQPPWPTFTYIQPWSSDCKNFWKFMVNLILLNVLYCNIILLLLHKVPRLRHELCDNSILAHIQWTITQT